jgi:hypothetical protein
MNERTDIIMAMRVDLTPMLVPVIAWWDAAETLAENDVPLDVAARVMALSMEQRSHRANLKVSSV